MNSIISKSLLLLALALLLADAGKADFNGGTLTVEYPEYTVVFCEDESTKTISVNLTNTFEFPLNVRVEKESVPKDLLVSSFDSDVLVLPGETETLRVFVTPQSWEYGDKSFLLAFTTENFTRTIPLNIFLRNCHGIKLTADAYSKDTCLFTSDEFEIVVNNTGNYDETLSVKLRGEGLEYAKLSKEGDDELIVPEGDFRKLFLFFYPSESTGDFDLVLEVFNDKIQKSLGLEVIVSKCSDFAIDMPGSATVCENCEETVNITLSNTGVYEDEYTITMLGPPGLVLSNSTVSVRPDDSAVINLRIPPACEEYGIYYADFIFSAKNAVGDKNKTLKIVVENCYDFGIDFEEPSLLCSCESLNSSVTLFNDGDEEHTYNISESSEFLTLLVNNTAVSPGGSAIIPFTFSSCEHGSYSIPIIITDNSSCHTKKVKNINFEVVTESECAKAVVNPAQQNYLLTSLAQYNIPITIKNVGIKNATYTFDFSGSAGSWVYAQSAHQLSMTVNDAGKFNLLVIPPEKITDDSYELVINVFSDDLLVGSEKIVFSKNKRTTPPIISYVTSDSEYGDFRYAIVVMLLLLVFLVLSNRGRLARFLRRNDN